MKTILCHNTFSRVLRSPLLVLGLVTTASTATAIPALAQESASEQKSPAAPDLSARMADLTRDLQVTTAKQEALAAEVAKRTKEAPAIAAPP